MYPFPQSVTPAIRSHLESQVAFLNDMSKSFSRSLQKFSELNIQLGQTLLEESSIAGHKLLTTDRPTDIFGIAAARAQPSAEKLRSYQHHISRAVADSQVDLSRVAEQHVAETSRTARALADEVARVSSEQTEQNLRTQEDALRNFRDPFQAQAQDGAHAHAQDRAGFAATAAGNLQRAEQEGQHLAAKTEARVSKAG
jgi:phasin family protein